VSDFRRFASTFLPMSLFLLNFATWRFARMSNSFFTDEAPSTSFFQCHYVAFAALRLSK
jgi:hypothetical protein